MRFLPVQAALLIGVLAFGCTQAPPESQEGAASPSSVTLPPTQTAPPATLSGPIPSIPPEISPTGTEAADILPGLAPDGAVRIGKGEITTFAAEGGLLAIGSSIGVCVHVGDSMDLVWCARTERPVQSLAFSPDAARLAVGLADGHLLLWDVERQVSLAERRISLYEGPSFLDFSPDGSLLAAVSPAKLSLWDGRTLDEGETLSRTPSPFAPAIFSPDGRYLAWIEHPTSVHLATIYDLDAGRQIASFQLDYWSYSLEWTADSGVLIVGLAGDIGCYENCTPTYTTTGATMFYDIASGEQRQISFELPDQAVQSLALGPDEERLALIVGEYFPKLLLVPFARSASDGEPFIDFQEAPANPHPYLGGLSWNAEGTSLLFLDEATRLRIWEPALNLVADLTPQGYFGAAWNMALSPDGTRLAQGFVGTGASILVRSLPDGNVLLEAPYPTTGLASLAWSPDGNQLAVVGYQTLDVVTIDADEIASLLELTPTEQAWQSFGSAMWTPDGEKLLLGMTDYNAAGEVASENMLLVDAESGEILQKLTGHGLLAALSADGTRAAVHRWGGEGATAYLTIWDLNSGQVLHSFTLSFGLYAFAWAPDGRSLAAFQDRSVIRIDALRGEILWSRPLGSLHVEELGYTQIAFSPDGRWVVTVGREAALWDAETGERVQVLAGHTKPIRALAFSTDGSQLVTSSEDGTVIVWEMPVP